MVSIPNPTKYTAVGKTFYVFTGKQLFVVAESYGGPNMMGLLKWGELHKKQAKLAEVLPKYLNKIAKPVKICDIMKVHRHPSNALLNF